MKQPWQRGDSPHQAAWAMAFLGVLSLGAGVWLALAGGEAAGAPADKGAGKKAADAPANDEVFQLPEGWRRADGSIDQTVLLTQEKRRLAVLNKKLKDPMKMSETAHYLIFSSAGDDVTLQFSRWSEALYLNLCRQFEIPVTEHLWDGKCILMIFATDADFRSHAKLFDEQNPKDKAAAYFLWERRSMPGVDMAKIPQLVHICIPVEKNKPAVLQELFAHEATHAFFEFYRRPGRLPLWLNEGLAVFVTVFNDPSLRVYYIRAAKGYATAGKTLKPLLDEKLDTLEPDQYALAYSIVEYLQTMGGAKFKQFVCALKDEKTVDDAMKAVYGFDLAGLEKAWRDYMAKASVAIRRN
jgi:hypothetical protein